jgi:hypothetical protein
MFTCWTTEAGAEGRAEGRATAPVVETEESEWDGEEAMAAEGREQV